MLNPKTVDDAVATYKRGLALLNDDQLRALVRSPAFAFRNDDPEYGRMMEEMETTAKRELVRRLMKDTAMDLAPAVAAEDGMVNDIGFCFGCVADEVSDCIHHHTDPSLAAHLDLDPMSPMAVY